MFGENIGNSTFAHFIINFFSNLNVDSICGNKYKAHFNIKTRKCKKYALLLWEQQRLGPHFTTVDYKLRS